MNSSLRVKGKMMINKKIFNISVGLLLVLSSFLMFGFDNVKTEKELLNEGNVIRSEVEYGNRIESLEKLENITDISIKAEVLSDKVNVKGKHYFGYTITNIKVKEIYRGENIKVGDIISIREPYCRNYLNGKEYLFIDAEYMPTEVGEEYIFILKSKDYLDKDNNIVELYGMWNTVLGKYPTINNKLRSTNNVDNITNGDLELNANNEDFKNIYKDILNNYI